MLMNNPRRKIIWEFWNNPYSEEEFIQEEVSEFDADNTDEMESYKIRSVVMTPIGLIPIKPFQSFNKTFQLWMAYTNFDITRKVKDQIEAINGVEILDIITRYCFRVAVGKCFDSKEVKIEIQKALGAMPPSYQENNPHSINLTDDLKEQVTLLKNTIEKDTKFWAIYVVPNGEIDYIKSDNWNEFEEGLAVYHTSQKMAGGIIYQYS